MGWLPTLDAGQTRIGFNGRAPQDLNKSPILVRPVVRVSLPWKLTAIVAAPPPFRAFGVTPHLLALGLERPVWQRNHWTLNWRGYGQVGSVKGAFSCPGSVLAFAPGSAGNPTSCVGESADVASLRYLGSEFQVAYRIPKMREARAPRFRRRQFYRRRDSVEGAGGAGLGRNQGVDARRYLLHDCRSQLLTHQTNGVHGRHVLLSPVGDAQCSTAGRTNDGLFNVRAMLSYSFR